MIVAELLSQETFDVVSTVPVDAQSGFWMTRREIALREKMLDKAFEQISEELRKSELRSKHPNPVIEYTPTREEFEEFPTNAVQYGTDPIIIADSSIKSNAVNGDGVPKKGQVSFSPPRAPSPPPLSRGRHPPPFEHHGHHGHRRRSPSRDSVFSHGASSIVTWAPTEPDAFSISMKVFSISLDEWVETIATMDTGCEGCNFISSTFLDEQLQMGADIEVDPEGEAMQLVDFAGKTDFKPLGKVRLKWYGRNIKRGRKGTRTIENTDWFRVAPHLTTEDGETPFQILLGKDWLHDNEVLTYRGLRLFKSKEKKGLSKHRTTTVNWAHTDHHKKQIHNTKSSFNAVNSYVNKLNWKDCQSD